MRVVDVKYDEYALVHTIKTKAGSSYILNKLYSKKEPLLLQISGTFSIITV